MVYLRSRRLCLDSPLALSICSLPSIHYSIFPSADFLGLSTVFVLIKFLIIGTSPFVFQKLTIGNDFVYSGMNSKMLNQETDECQYRLIFRAVSSSLFVSLTLTSEKSISFRGYSTVNLMME